ncbi:biotin/lipoyl-binding protein [Klebsiella pneumoniae]|nr:biotin/lipoyl-binding protein [Klebsiella pneumoniae]EIX9489130.1 biotin/lipoyl-binding protein [Klebsiella pneumoniae]
MTTSRTSLLRKKWPLLALVLAAILALILVIWQLQTSPETNDAYVYADTIDVVPEVSGRIVEMPIRDNQRVKKGDLLFRIDPRPYQAMLDDAKARLTTLDAQIMLTQRTIKAQEYNAQSVAAAVERARALVKQTTSTRIRLEPLVPQGFASQEDLDQARTAEKAARAELEATLLQAKQASAAVTGVDAMVAQRAGVLAQIALAELHLEFTEVRAPFNGVVVALKTTVGQYASALKTTVGQYASALKPVFTLLDDDRWYVIANFRETDLNNVRPGVAARITVMTNHNRTFNGVVDSVGSGVLPEGGSVIEGLPLIQKSINWVHVSQRFPVKIAVSDPDPELFRMGASASAVLQP